MEKCFHSRKCFLPAKPHNLFKSETHFCPHQATQLWFKLTLYIKILLTKISVTVKTSMWVLINLKSFSLSSSCNKILWILLQFLFRKPSLISFFYHNLGLCRKSKVLGPPARESYNEGPLAFSGIDAFGWVQDQHHPEFKYRIFVVAWVLLRYPNLPIGTKLY